MAPNGPANPPAPPLILGRRVGAGNGNIRSILIVHVMLVGLGISARWGRIPIDCRYSLNVLSWHQTKQRGSSSLTRYIDFSAATYGITATPLRTDVPRTYAMHIVLGMHYPVGSHPDRLPMRCQRSVVA